MIFLLAKYTLLFLLAAVLGFMLGYWFSRRNVEDVSESFEDLRKANERSDDANWKRLWGQLTAIPEPKEVDLRGVNERLDHVATTLSQLPQPEPVNLQPLVDQVQKLENDIKAIPAPAKSVSVDVSPVTGKIEALQAAIRSIPRPEPQRDVNFQPIDDRLRAIEKELGRLGKRLETPAKVEQETRTESREEPQILSAALYGNKDNLKLISGIGPKLESLLNENGVYYFWQVAEWNDNDIEIIDERLDAFKGRIGRDSWVSQARSLRRSSEAAGRPTDL